MLLSRFFLLFISLILQLSHAHEVDCDAVCEDKVNDAVAAVRQELEGQLNDKAAELDSLKRVLEAAISRRDELEQGTANHVKEIHNVKRQVEEMKAKASEADAAVNKLKEEVKISQERLLSVTEEVKKKDNMIRELESIGLLDFLIKRTEPWIKTIVAFVKGNKIKEQDL